MLATLAVYSPVRAHPFVVFDDHEYVVENLHVQQGLSLAMVKWAFTAAHAANWHPLTWLSHALDCQLFALNPAGHHWDSLLLHALSAGLLFLLLEWGTGSTGASFVVAALFALHPLNVESVAWIAERKNVLSTLLWLMAIGAYGWYARRPGWRRYLLVMPLFALGLMAKPMVITLPFVFLLLDYWPLNRVALTVEIQGPASETATRSQESRRQEIPRPAGENAGLRNDATERVERYTSWDLLLEKIPLLLLSAASAVITMKAQVLTEGTLLEYPIAVRIENAVVAYGLYLWKMLWPVHLAAMYPHPGRNLSVWQVLLSVLVLSAISVIVIAYHSRRYLLVGWLWFLGTLVPVIGLVQVGYAAMADRYAYVPLIGIFVMLAFGGRDVAEAKHVHLAYRIAPAICVLLALAFLTHRQLGYWSSDYDVWAHALHVTSGNVFAHNAIGSALLAPDISMSASDLEGFDTREKRMEEARSHYEQSLRICREHAAQDSGIYLPALANTLNYLGDLDRVERHMEDARKRYTESLEIHRELVKKEPQTDIPYLATTLNTLGMLDRIENRPEEARAYFLEALHNLRQLQGAGAREYMKDVALTLNDLATLALQQKEFDEADRYYEQALQLRRQLARREPILYLPDVAATLDDIGGLSLNQQRFEAARHDYEEALSIYRELARNDPGKFLYFVAGMLNELGMVEKTLNQIDAARGRYEEALDIYQKLAKDDPSRYALYVQAMELSMAQLGPQSR